MEEVCAHGLSRPHAKDEQRRILRDSGKLCALGEEREGEKGGANNTILNKLNKCLDRGVTSSHPQSDIPRVVFSLVGNSLLKLGGTEVGGQHKRRTETFLFCGSAFPTPISRRGGQEDEKFNKKIFVCNNLNEFNKCIFSCR